MTIQQAIEKAIEGGWNPNPQYWMVMKPQNWGVDVRGDDSDSERWTIKDLVLDPSFWKCLVNSGKPFVLVSGSWKSYWHRLIDHLAEGKSIESYFETL